MDESLQSVSLSVRRAAPPATVLLIGLQEQGHLGLGYLASTLRQHGYSVLLADLDADPGEILRTAQAANPILVGFSLIFQFYVNRLGALVRYLRTNGIAAHFTMGGHFPSLNYRQTFELIPELDSIVRFEGELTLLELVERLSAGTEWRLTASIAYRQDGEIRANPVRPLVADLDRLPYPARDFEPITVLGHRAAPILASRGCARSCSFCSIHSFYRSVPGKVVRTRRPSQVAEEMHVLHEERGINIFLFQDDDFPLFGPVWRRWAAEFIEELQRRRLPGRAIWKISCRVDSVESQLFAALRQAGLYLVYLGLESGNDGGLQALHKGVTVEQNLRAVAALKEQGILCHFGFMMFDPSSTFASVRANVRFLREVVGDGSAAAVFCRMLPYEGTAIKADLERSGRLRGGVCDPDYDFLDPRLDRFFADLHQLIHATGWIHGSLSVATQLDWAWNEVAVMERLFPSLPGMARYRQELQSVTRESNDLLLRIVEDLSWAHSEGTTFSGPAEELPATCQGYVTRLLAARNGFVGRNQSILLQAIGQTVATPGLGGRQNPEAQAAAPT